MAFLPTTVAFFQRSADASSDPFARITWRGCPRGDAAKPVDRHPDVIRQEFQDQAQCCFQNRAESPLNLSRHAGPLLFPSFVCAKP
jgi:hypothetical protein